MKDTSTPLNSELLSADARGRKHIPVAVFAVILIHVVLFLVLLIAAGCRSSARAKRAVTPEAQIAAQQTPALPTTTDTSTTQLFQQENPVASTSEVMPSRPVVATEPVVQQAAEPAVSRPAPAERQVTQRDQPVRPRPARNTPKAAPQNAKVYVVKSGDTLGEIAQRHGVTIQAIRSVNNIKKDLIYPGQKLRLAPESSAPLQVRSEKQNRSKEA